MNVAHCDIETYCDLDLTRVGAYCYSEHPSCRILVVGYAINDGPVQLWVPEDDLPAALHRDLRRQVKTRVGCEVPMTFGTQCPPDLKAADQYRAHNAPFEYVVGNSHAGHRIDFPQTRISDWRCTAAKAAVAGLPRDLQRACDAIKAPYRKDETNRNAMLKLAKPRKPSKFDARTRWTWENAYEDFLAMYKYNVGDVRAQRALDDALPDLPPTEQAVFELDTQINDRGWAVDLAAIDDVQFLLADYKARIARNCERLTGVRPTQREALANWLRGRGVKLPDMTAPSVAEALPRLKDRAARQVLKIYRSHNMKAPAKYVRMRDAACWDRRLRGMFMYYGAGPGRWSSRVVQLQNLFRSVIPDPDNAIALMRTRDLSLLTDLYGEDPMQIFASCIRGMLVARPGKVLRCADFNAIEGRIVAWLAGQEDKLQVYRTHGLAYEHTAAQLFGLDDRVEALKRQKQDHPDARFAGKTSELALGFQGGTGALQRAARAGGRAFDDAFAEELVLRWRQANPAIVALWKALEDSAIAAVEQPGRVVRTHRIAFKVRGDWLFVRLPSGRRLAYYRPIVQGEGRAAKLTYWGMDTETRQWMRVDTHGGRWTQNIASAIARDKLVQGMLRLDAAGYRLVGTIHDEIVSEDDPTFGSVEEIEQIMCATSEWDVDLPVTATGGWEGLRYKKD